MAKTQNKTLSNDASVLGFLNKIEHDGRRQDAFTLLELFKTTTDMPAKMWGTSIVGFGRYHYKYESGREGEYLMSGFRIRTY